MRQGAQGHRPNDDGTVLFLTIGLSVVLLLLVAVVVDLSAVILAKRGMSSAADGAAVAAAQRVDTASVDAGNGLGNQLPLDEGLVQDLVLPTRTRLTTALPDCGWWPASTVPRRQWSTPTGPSRCPSVAGSRWGRCRCTRPLAPSHRSCRSD